MVVDKENAAKKQKGSKSLPKGVIETGRKAIKYQARVSYKPDGSKTVQRNAGTFDTPEEAALQVAAYEAKLAEGIDPWNGEQVRSQHGRGQVRSQSPYAQCAPIARGTSCPGHVLVPWAHSPIWSRQDPIFVSLIQIASYKR